MQSYNFRQNVILKFSFLNKIWLWQAIIFYLWSHFLKPSEYGANSRLQQFLESTLSQVWF